MAEEGLVKEKGDSFLAKDSSFHMQLRDQNEEEPSSTKQLVETTDTPEKKNDVVNENNKESKTCNTSTDSKDTVFEDSPLSRSVDFMYETKYMMLNFMSLVPPDMYRGHVSVSPEPVGFEPQFGKKFARPGMYLSKSKSFDTGLQHRKPQLKLLGKMKTLQKHMESPASEDNLSYHYQNNLKTLGSPDCQRFNSDPWSPQPALTVFEKSHSAHEFSNYSSPSHSPQKGRLFSDASSSGELSYMSDADDELEEYSNASSIFSSRSISSRDGFLDLRRSVHILPTLPSQSEEMDEADGYIATSDDHESQTVSETEHRLETVTEIPDGAQQVVSNVDGTAVKRPTPDRSKLKLNIPCAPVQLDDILLSLQTELSSELDEMESEFEEALHSARDRMTHSAMRTPLTPQTEAARVLARIGDEVKTQYGARLAAAVNSLTYQQISNLSYEQFRDIAGSVVSSEVPGWRQVALLMVFGQKIIWGSIQHGQTHFGNLIDYSSQVVAEFAADFIIKQGGWGSVMNFDPSSSDNQSSENFDMSPEMVVDYFTSHDITQVESERGLNDSPGQPNDKVSTDKHEENGKEGDNDLASSEHMSDTSMIGIQTLTIKGYNTPASNPTKSRYASSVGFEYTDTTDDTQDVDDKSGQSDCGDSEEMLFEAAIRDKDELNTVTALTEREVENSDEVFKDSSVKAKKISLEISNDLDKTGMSYDKKVDREGEGHSNTSENTAQNPEIQDSSDLNSVIIPEDLIDKGYDRDSVYVRQDTPTVSPFDKVNGITDTEEVIPVGKSTSENHMLGFNDSQNANTVTMLSDESKSKENSDRNDCSESIRYISSVAGSVKFDQDSNHNANSFESQVGGNINEKEDIENTNNNEINEDSLEHEEDRDCISKKAVHYNNQIKTNDRNSHSVKENPRNNKANSKDDTNNDVTHSDVTNTDGVSREVDEESHMLSSLGAKAAALALAVLVVGVSVRIALNR